MNKTRVVHIITKLTLGGAQENTIYTYFNHDRSKFEVFLLAGADDRYGGQWFTEKLEKDEHVCFIKGLSNSFNMIIDIKIILQIYFFLRINKIDVVHTHSSKAGVLGRIAAKAAGVPAIVHTVHGWSFHERMKKCRKKIYIYLERLAARLCDMLITVTVMDIEKGLKEHIGNRGKYMTIRSGIDFKRFDEYDRNKVKQMKSACGGKKIIGTVGRISEQKNLSDFIYISKKLMEKRDDLYFVIVGDGPDSNKISDLIKTYKLEQHIMLMGTRHDIQDFMHTFDVLVLTSLWEGLPRVIPEAMYCGVPVVANNVDGVAEIIENDVNGFSTVPYDLDGSCLSIERLIDDGECRDRIVKNAHLTICFEYDAQIMVNEIEQLYENILQRKNFIQQ